MECEQVDLREGALMLPICLQPEGVQGKAALFYC